MGGLVLHCHSRLRPPGGQQSLPPRPPHSSSSAPSSPDLTAAQPQGRFRALGPGFWRSPLASSCPSLECPPATFTSLARNVPGAGDPYPLPRVMGALRPSPGCSRDARFPCQLGAVAESGPSGFGLSLGHRPYIYETAARSLNAYWG